MVLIQTERWEIKKNWFYSCQFFEADQIKWKNLYDHMKKKNWLFKHDWVRIMKKINYVYQYNSTWLFMILIILKVEYLK